jgi:tRNA(Leu) C34 or U34 (ribose-2'-O)-methylase TrmL
MFGVCFYYSDFDRDISSGTPFALQQWSELLNAFNVKNKAIINLSDEKIDQNCFQVFNSLEYFKQVYSNKNIVFTKATGSMNYREVDYSKIDWLCFGSFPTWTTDGISIPTFEKKEIYPREAAAIILSEARWQLR